jgi:hypothetical protein
VDKNMTLKKAKVYQFSKVATQSGVGKAHLWILEPETPPAQHRDNLMRWTGSGKTINQISLRFPSLEEALQYAHAQGICVEVIPPKKQTSFVTRPYQKNFTHRL